MTESNITNGNNPNTPDDAQALQKQMEEYLNGWKRAKADLANYQRETERRQQELVAYAHVGAIVAFLPIIENLEKAVTHMTDEVRASEWGKGLVQLEKQFRDLFVSMGVVKIETVGKSFSVELHEAVGRRAQEGSPPGTILEEVQTGYTMHGKVLRPAKVIVSE